jgi:hypothetical protein
MHKKSQKVEHVISPLEISKMTCICVCVCVCVCGVVLIVYDAGNYIGVCDFQGVSVSVSAGVSVREGVGVVLIRVRREEGEERIHKSGGKGDCVKILELSSVTWKSNQIY